MSQRQGDSSTDTFGLLWDVFEIKPVDTDSVKISVDSVYTTNNNGFVEVEIFGGETIVLFLQN